MEMVFSEFYIQVDLKKLNIIKQFNIFCHSFKSETHIGLLFKFITCRVKHVPFISCHFNDYLKAPNLQSHKIRIMNKTEQKTDIVNSCGYFWSFSSYTEDFSGNYFIGSTNVNVFGSYS